MRMLLPESATADARRLLLTRGVRGFADGVVSVLLASHLTRLGLTPLEVGAIVTGTLLGSAVLTIALGLAGHRLDSRRVLLGACVLMAVTGMGFAGFTAFWPLLIVAVVGTLNPSAGDVSVFLPAEQAALAHAVSGRDRTSLFAWYNVVGTFAGALGALASALPAMAAHRFGIDLTQAERFGFVLYSAIAVLAALVYLRLTPAGALPSARGAGPLTRSRGVVLRLSVLFSLDSFGGGFAVQSLVVLWLYRRFDLSPAATGSIFFASGLVGALSQFISGRLAARIGHINTMVFTHLPANVFLMLAGLMPTPGLAVLFLLLRASLSQMDVPARQAYVMSVVPPEERAAASSVTNVPRSLASALPPLFAGVMLDHSTLGWPLVCAGVIKVAYDLLLLARFRAVKPLDEQ